MRRRSAFGLLLMLLGGAAGSNGAEPGAATVTIGGEVRFKKKAPVFLRLTALDESGKEVVVREQVLDLSSEDVASGRLRFVFAGLTPGRYALKCFQDTNGNRKIDIGLFGPKEPWATYRLARPKLRAPRFEELAFDAPADVTDADLVMR